MIHKNRESVMDVFTFEPNRRIPPWAKVPFPESQGAQDINTDHPLDSGVSKVGIARVQIDKVEVG